MGIARSQTVIRTGDPLVVAGVRLAGAAARGAVVHRAATAAEWNLFNDIPTEPNSGDYTLGVLFSSSIPGTVISMRMWLAANNNVTFQLRSSSGAVIASAVTSGSAASWATAAFSPPVPIVAATQYWATWYGDNMGAGILSDQGLSLPLVAGPLTVTTFGYAAALDTAPDNEFSDWYGPDLTFREGN